MAKKSSNSYANADFYTQKAHKEGYPARSVYKLEEIDQKCALIKSSMKILDVGAAPGSWSKYILKKIGAKGFLCAIDLKEIVLPATENSLFLQGDAFCEENVNKILQFAPYDVVVCDAAPATTGNKVVDVAASSGLVEEVINLSSKVLKAGGNLVVKIFQGGQEQALTKEVLKIFESCKKLKPAACRKESFESYLIGLNKKEF